MRRQNFQGGGSPPTPPAVAPDWANDAPALDSADWVDSTAIGGLVSTYREDTPLGIRLVTPLEEDGVTPVAGVRAQGALHAIPAGDFTAALRLRFDTPDDVINVVANVVAAGAVFIDGASAAANSWYGPTLYYNTNITDPDLYRFETTGGANRFNAVFPQYTAADLSIGTLGPSDYDFFFVRSGTTLTTYIGRAGNAAYVAHAWNVSAGAGYIGPRIQHLLSSPPPTVQCVIVAFDPTLTALPF